MNTYSVVKVKNNFITFSQNQVTNTNKNKNKNTKHGDMRCQKDRSDILFPVQCLVYYIMFSFLVLKYM